MKTQYKIFSKEGIFSNLFPSHSNTFSDGGTENEYPQIINVHPSEWRMFLCHCSYKIWSCGSGYEDYNIKSMELEYECNDNMIIELQTKYKVNVENINLLRKKFESNSKHSPGDSEKTINFRFQKNQKGIFRKLGCCQHF